MGARYVHNHAAFGQEVHLSGWMRSLMNTRGKLVEAAAIATAPRDTGEYAASFDTHTRIVTGYGEGPRWAARVSNHSDHALAVEFGWGKTPRYRTLGKALGAAG